MKNYQKVIMEVILDCQKNNKRLVIDTSRRQGKRFIAKAINDVGRKSG